MDNISLASDLLHEIKLESRRRFVALIILIVALVGNENGNRKTYGRSTRRRNPYETRKIYAEYVDK